MRAAPVTAFFEPRARPAWAGLCAVFRVLTVLFALQFGGVIHDVTDLMPLLTPAAQHEHEQCPADGPCDDCPTGCANCHCAAAGAIVIDAASTSLLSPLGDSMPARPHPLRTPSGPELPSLFKPPRA